MQPLQRLVSTVVVTGIALAAAPGYAQAQAGFPAKPVRMVTSTTAGGQPDTIARMIIQNRQDATRQTDLRLRRDGQRGPPERREV